MFSPDHPMSMPKPTRDRIAKVELTPLPNVEGLLPPAEIAFNYDADDGLVFSAYLAVGPSQTGLQIQTKACDGGAINFDFDAATGRLIGIEALRFARTPVDAPEAVEFCLSRFRGQGDRVTLVLLGHIFLEWPTVQVLALEHLQREKQARKAKQVQRDRIPAFLTEQRSLSIPEFLTGTADKATPRAWAALAGTET